MICKPCQLAADENIPVWHSYCSNIARTGEKDATWCDCQHVTKTPVTDPGVAPPPEALAAAGWPAGAA